MNLIIFILCAVGSYCLLTATYPGIYAPAAAALRKRAPKPLNRIEVLIAALAEKIQPLIDLEPMKRVRLADNLKSLGRTDTPEGYQAKAMAKALIVAGALAWLLAVSPIFGAVAMGVAFAVIYQGGEKQLNKEMAIRRQRIERELPQFAATIRQSLNSTGDVISIFSSYRRICGPALAGEIDRTLNDMVTGNQERAIVALESRVASPQLGQLTRGLVSVLRGDDQKTYFEMLTEEYRKSQNESVKKELLSRPAQLNPYMGLLFVAFLLIVASALGKFILSQFQAFS
ncbi:MAG: hypothetical protein RSC08_05870 [Oscillospiraceae bacterium]